MRAVLDPNVIISALLSSQGAPARVVRAWTDGEFDLVVSPLLLAELDRALGYPKLRRRIVPDDARRAIEWLARFATVVDDPAEPPGIRSEDPGDDYLLALAAATRAALVSGDAHLLALADRVPIFTAAEFLGLLSE